MSTSKMNTHKATLVRGLTYYLGNKRFDKGVPVPVTDAEKDLLDEYAVDPVSVGNSEDGEEVDSTNLPKFTFKAIDAEESEGATNAKPAPAARTRKQG